MAQNRMRGVIRFLIMAHLIGFAPAFVQNAWADADSHASPDLNAPAAEDETAPADDDEQDDGAAQDESAEQDGDLTSEFADDISDIRKLAQPDGSEEYSEIYQMRVLERSLLPSNVQNEGQNNGQNLLYPPVDPMGLAPDELCNILGSGSSDEYRNRGLQRQATKLMSSAIQAIQNQIQSAGTGLVLPFGLDCAQQKSVQEYIAIFSAPGSSTMKIWLKRMARWKPALERVLAQEGVPLELVYLAMIESGFKPRVKSPAAAAGMWQFMAGTAIEMGLHIDSYVDERFDPIKSAHAAAGYLKKQYDRYNSWPLAMAAYNGGPGTVNIAIDRYNTTDYFKLVEYGAMYDETRRYVPRILAAAIIGQNPKTFGFDGLKGEEPFVFDTVEVPGNMRLAVLAEAANCSVETLQELNPELLKTVTPPGDNYALRIPAGRFSHFVDHFDDVKRKYAKHSDSMTLRFGETIDILAVEIDVPARVLRQINQLSSKENLSYGSEVIVPNGSKRRKSAEKDEKDRPVALVSPETFTFNQKKRVFYVTQKGDAIAAIARAFGILPNQLAIWNDLDIWAKLRPNMYLQIFVDKSFDDDAIRYFSEDEVRVVVKGSSEHRDIIYAKRKTSSARSYGSHYVYHTVAKGDSISKIAKKYGVSVNSILKLNKMKASDVIRKGEKLKVKRR